MSSYELRYENYLKEFEAYAIAYADSLKTRPSVLGESMRYSLLNGG